MKSMWTATGIWRIVLAATMWLVSGVPAPGESSPGGENGARVIDVAPVWAGHPVGFCLLTQGDRQFVGFYDAERRMTIGVREIGSHSWHFKHLEERVGWDSHNYITMAIDASQNLHVSGNMHGVPLVYFRGTRPLDMDSLERVPAMVGRNEQRCTYPEFLRGPLGELLFTYRDGGSGNGDQIYNVYDPTSRTWRRLIEGPLVSGEGERNAYIHGPIRDKSGVFHMCWVWRETPDCATNHDLSYARSRDLVHWETSAGKPLMLPITLGTAEIVDPVPEGGGIINGNTRIGFDSRGNPILSYHKYDAGGATQIYNARREGGAWRIVQASDWTWRWDFSGGGSISFDVIVGTVEPAAPGRLRQSWSNAHHGSGVWLLDEATLRPIGPEKPEVQPATAERKAATVPAEAARPAAGMVVRRAGDLGSGGEKGVRYELRWETLGPNRDHAREGPIPPPSMLRVWELRKK